MRGEDTLRSVRKSVPVALASPGRIELPASRLGGARSIHLSYGDEVALTN